MLTECITLKWKSDVSVKLKAVSPLEKITFWLRNKSEPHHKTCQPLIIWKSSSPVWILPVMRTRFTVWSSRWDVAPLNHFVVILDQTGAVWEELELPYTWKSIIFPLWLIQPADAMWCWTCWKYIIGMKEDLINWRLSLSLVKDAD